MKRILCFHVAISFLLICLYSPAAEGSPRLVADTLIATAKGSTTPPRDPNGNPVMNGDFTISRSGGNDLVGDGIDERTQWRLTYDGEGIDSTDRVVSALLTVTLEPKDASADNDNIEIDDCDCPDIDVGQHPLHQIYTISFEMLDYGYMSQLFIDSLRLNGGFIMEYQDDAIMSFAEVQLIVEPNLQITSPQDGERWMVGEENTIRWEGRSINGWNIYFSADDGFSYTQFETILPPEDRMFSWNVPDTLETSSNYRVKVVDVLNSDLEAVSGSFTIRALDLVRRNTDGTLEVYKPSRHGWSVGNEEDILWPASWYQQFDYRTGIDPFTGNVYHRTLAIETGAQSSDFPDWPSFVRTYGVNKCYETSLFGDPTRPNQRAMAAWTALKSPWNGSCFGLPLSALLAFEQSTSFFSQNPQLPVTTTIFDLTSVEPLRTTINKYFLYQNDTTHVAHIDNNLLTVSPRELLEDIREMLMDDVGPHRILALNPPKPAGHAVIPHKLVRDPVTEGQFRLYVYDPNEAGENREYILIDSLANTWEEFLGLEYGQAEEGLFLDLLSDHFLQQPILGLLEEPPSISAADGSGGSVPTSKMSLYVSSGPDILILSASGDSVGYSGGRIIRTMAGASPLIPVVGVLTPPIGYSLPAGQYFVTMNQFRDSASSVLFSEGGRLYHYERLDADSGQVDAISIGDGFSLKSEEAKVVSLKTIGGSSANEWFFAFLNLQITAGDSVAIAHLPTEEARLANFGEDKAYDLRAQHLGTGIERALGHDDILLPANTTHYVIAADTSLTTVRILVDLGNDGTIDDTMFVVNTVGVDEEANAGIPKDYHLTQNYPNPFNPATVISYQLPVASYVTLRVYDILGRHIATLADGVQDAGYKRVNFDASGLASGLYFYRIEARGTTANQTFIDVKKMIVVK